MSNVAAVTPVAESRGFVETPCFHCGLPVADPPPAPLLDVHGEERHFCCHGCHAVCKAIIDSGLDDYYRFRTDPAVSGTRGMIPEFLDRVELCCAVCRA
jgi:Cu2+-exporting ATPase